VLFARVWYAVGETHRARADGRTEQARAGLPELMDGNRRGVSLSRSTGMRRTRNNDPRFDRLPQQRLPPDHYGCRRKLTSLTAASVHRGSGLSRAPKSGGHP
jgi:hypothetical protein